MLEYDQNEQAELPDPGNFSVKIIGVGGAGANVLDRMTLNGTEDADMLTLNTDVRALSTSVSNNKIQLGKELLKGMGAGGDPELGRQAAIEVEDQIRASVKGHNMVFVCAGLGGGTGSGAAPEVCRIVKEEGVFLVAFTTLPFSFEGARRMAQAKEALDRISENANAVITFENDRMGSLIVPKDGIQSAFQAADDTISESVRATTNIVTQPGIIRIGMDDLLSALRNRDSRCLFGHGQAKGENRALEALNLALKSPLIDKGKLLDQTRNVLVHVSGGDTLTLFEVELLMKELNKHVGSNTQLMFGVGSDKKLGASLSVTIISSLSEGAPQTPSNEPDQDDPEKKKIASRPEDSAHALVGDEAGAQAEEDASASAPLTDMPTALGVAAVAGVAGAGLAAAGSVALSAAASEAKQVEPAVEPTPEPESEFDSDSEDILAESEEVEETSEQDESESAADAEQGTVDAEAVAEVETVAEAEGEADDVDDESAPAVEEESQTVEAESAADTASVEVEDDEPAPEIEAEAGASSPAFSDDLERAGETDIVVEQEPAAEEDPEVTSEPASEDDDGKSQEPQPEVLADADIEDQVPEADLDEPIEAPVLTPVPAPPAELMQALAPLPKDEREGADDETAEIERAAPKKMPVSDFDALEPVAEDIQEEPVSEPAASVPLLPAEPVLQASEEESIDDEHQVEPGGEAKIEAHKEQGAKSGIGIGWSSLKTTGTIGALLREGRIPVRSEDDDDEDDDEAVVEEEVQAVGLSAHSLDVDDDSEENSAQSIATESEAAAVPVVSSPFEIGDDDDIDDDEDLPVAEMPDAEDSSSVPPWLQRGLPEEDQPESLNPIAQAMRKKANGPGASKPMMSIRDMAKGEGGKAASNRASNELEFVESSAHTSENVAPAESSAESPELAAPTSDAGEAAPTKGGTAPIKPLLPGVDPNEVVSAGSGASNMIRLTRLSDSLGVRSETTPIAPLDSLPANDDVTQPIYPGAAGNSAALEPNPVSPPVNVSPISPPPGLRPAEAAVAAAAAAKAKADQAMLNLEPTSKGRFAKSEPTIVDGQDLDVPTLLRVTKKP